MGIDSRGDPLVVIRLLQARHLSITARDSPFEKSKMAAHAPARKFDVPILPALDSADEVSDLRGIGRQRHERELEGTQLPIQDLTLPNERQGKALGHPATGMVREEVAEEFLVTLRRFNAQARGQGLRV